MHLVRAAARAPALAGVALIAIAIAAGCGGSGSEEQASSGGGPDISSLPINLADCEDWQKASVEERLATVRQIRQYTGGPLAGSKGQAEGNVLDDEEAYDYFEGYCDQEFARGFKLYKLYGRASAFQDTEAG